MRSSSRPTFRRASRSACWPRCASSRSWLGRPDHRPRAAGARRRGRTIPGRRPAPPRRPAHGPARRGHPASVADGGGDGGARLRRAPPHRRPPAADRRGTGAWIAGAAALGRAIGVASRSARGGRSSAKGSYHRADVTLRGDARSGPARSASLARPSRCPTARPRPAAVGAARAELAAADARWWLGRAGHPGWFAPRSRPAGRACRRLADALAARGVASLRYDPRGCGESGGDWAASHLFTRIDDARDAIGAMRSRRELDLRRTAIVGHGEGGSSRSASPSATRPSARWA